MAKLGPFSEGYPVNFRSGGDTTKEAFWKHIQEINKIYGILTAIDANAVSADDLGGVISGEVQRHIDAENPHPNWKPSLNFDDITGNLAASRVEGKLTNATIDASRVNGLKDFVDDEIDDKLEDFDGGGGTGDGIIDKSIAENGYVKFANGLIVQWGQNTLQEVKTSSNDGVLKPDSIQEVSFAYAFPSKCLNVSLTMLMQSAHIEAHFTPQLIKPQITKTSFKYMLQFMEYPIDNVSTSEFPRLGSTLGVSYIAIGY